LRSVRVERGIDFRVTLTKKHKTEKRVNPKKKPNDVKRSV